MITQSSPISQIYAEILPGSVRVLADDLALHHFRESHPADYTNTHNHVVSSMFEDQNILHLPRSFIEHASKSTSGVSKHYFSGLLFAHRNAKQVVERTVADCNSGTLTNEYALELIQAHLEAICKVRYETLYNSIYQPCLAFDYAVLEMATFLLIHTHPEQGKMWINRLYHL